MTRQCRIADRLGRSTPPEQPQRPSLFSWRFSTLPRSFSADPVHCHSVLARSPGRCPKSQCPWRSSSKRNDMGSHNCFRRPAEQLAAETGRPRTSAGYALPCQSCPVCRHYEL